NGSYCVQIYEQTGGHWVGKNTCYKNALDLEDHGCGPGMHGGCQTEVGPHSSHDNYFVNNIVRSWDIQHTYEGCCVSYSNRLDHNLWYGDGSNQLSAFSVLNNLINADPRFIDAPYVSDQIPAVPGTGWFADALDPRQLGDGLQLRGNSPAINAGIDPTTLTGDPDLQAGLRRYVYQDINGVSRPAGGA